MNKCLWLQTMDHVSPCGKCSWIKNIVFNYLWCWRRPWGVLWTARRSNQSMPKEVNPDYSLEGLMLKLKRQYFGHLMQRASSQEKTLMLGKIGDKRRRGWQRMRCLDSITDPMDMNLSTLWKKVGDRGDETGMLQSIGSIGLACCSPLGHRVRHDLVTEQQ